MGVFFDDLDDYEDFDEDLEYDDHDDVYNTIYQHAHVMSGSQAQDSDFDGFSDALEIRIGADPNNPQNHPDLGNDYSIPQSFGANLHISNDKTLLNIDSDQDGFDDLVEKMMGTNPFDSTSHPDAVLPHHFNTDSTINDDIGIDDNLEGTIDATIKV